MALKPRWRNHETAANTATDRQQAGDTAGIVPADSDRAQHRRVHHLLEQLDPVYDALHVLTGTAEDVIHIDNHVFREFGELAETEKRDLWRHLDQAAESIRAADG